MRTLTPLAMIGLIALSAAACSDDEDTTQPPAAEVYVANLSGNQEVPAVTTTATGSGRVTFTNTGFDYTLSVTGVPGTITGAHIHGPAAAGSNAGVALNVNPNVAALVNGTGVLATGSASAATTLGANVTLDSLKSWIRTGRAYFNVHTQANAGGHIRGQLSRQ